MKLQVQIFSRTQRSRENKYWKYQYLDAGKIEIHTDENENKEVLRKQNWRNLKRPKLKFGNHQNEKNKGQQTETSGK